MKFFKFTEKENYTELIFDNTKAANSFGQGPAEELLELLKQLPLKPVLWQSAGRAPKRNIFCAGGDLKAYKKLTTKKQGVAINRKILEALDALYMFKHQKIAYLDGDVYGGGLEVLSCFDKVVALPDVKIAFWQSKQNLSTGWGGFTRWSQKVDAALLKKLIKSTEIFSPQKAIEYGFVDKVVESVDEISFDGSHAPKQKLDYVKEVELFESLWWSKEHLSILNTLKI